MIVVTPEVIVILDQQLKYAIKGTMVVIIHGIMKLEVLDIVEITGKNLLIRENFG